MIEIKSVLHTCVKLRELIKDKNTLKPFKRKGGMIKVSERNKISFTHLCKNILCKKVDNKKCLVSKERVDAVLDYIHR